MTTGPRSSEPRTKELFFPSKGLRCAARLYLPPGGARPPVVVMAHGLAAEREFGLPAYAERFAAAGLAVVLFDYRNFGGSEGSPRNIVDPKRHLEDWRAAVAFARSLPDVDGSRLALWGTSFSGGHVLVTAARDPGVRAAVVQVPFVGGLSSASLFPAAYQAEAVLHGLRDALSAAFGGRPHTVPAISLEGKFSLLHTPDARMGFEALVPKGYPFNNAVPARFLLKLPFYYPARYASRIRCPVLLMAAEKDLLIPIASVDRVADKIPDCIYERLPLGHFEIYVGEAFERAVAQQTAFLVEKLGVRPPRAEAHEGNRR